MNTSIHLAKRPKDRIVPGETFKARRTPIPTQDDVKQGEVLVRVDYLSVDPGLFTCLLDGVNVDCSNERLVE